MGRLKEAWLADVETEDLLARAYAWEDEQRFEQNLRLHDQVKSCADLGDTLMLHACIEKLPPRMAGIIDRLQRELCTLSEMANEIL